MRGRQVCWSDPDIQKLAREFVPATDEVWRLHNRKELDCLFFQGFCEQGHYGGRSEPTTTRQGIYCCTPAGAFLGSVNTVDPARMARMLRSALDAWRAVPPSERRLTYDPAARAKEIRRPERAYPEDGLALRVYARDGVRADLPADWRAEAWNVDSLWFRKAEAAALVPSDLVVGAEHAWPRRLAERLVRHHLVDNVRGQTNGFRARDVQEAEIRTRVVRVRGDVVHVVISGRSRTTTSGTWPQAGRFDGMEVYGPWTRGVRVTMYGEATYDRATGRFTRFELAARGTRWGQTRYNGRRDDTDEAPIAFAIVYDEQDPARRVAPAELGAYGW